MCIEDIRLGRQTNWTEANVAVGVTSGNLVAAAPNRVVLIFSPPAAGTVTFSSISPVVAGAGFALNSSGLPIVMNIETWGGGVQAAWFAIASVATSIQVGQGILAQQ